MIHQAYQYMAKPWLAGCSSSPAYGVDCSGLVMQSLYAGGISPTSTSSIGHAHPGNEWNSRNLWADTFHILNVNVAILSFTTNQVLTLSGTLQSTLATIALSRVGHHA